MTAEEFETFWATTYPDTIPVAHFFKQDYIDRWFRIHSLPESKRYAESHKEWHELLNRQNMIITDLLGNNGKILLMTGNYHLNGYTELHSSTKVKSIQNISFTTLSPIDLHKLRPEEYDEGHVFKPMFSEQVWQSHKYDDVLIDIAKDDLRAFFFSVENHCIVAPYDGGIDFVVNDKWTKEVYKEKYKEWLSRREDGL